MGTNIDVEKRNNRCHIPPEPEIFLSNHLSYMRRLLAELEVLADNLHIAGREERAAAISRLLLAAFPAPDNARQHANENFDVAGDPDVFSQPLRVHQFVDTWAGSLRSIVLRGVYEIASARLPAEPAQFVSSAVLLCEVLRLHIGVLEESMDIRPRPRSVPASWAVASAGTRAEGQDVIPRPREHG